MYIRHGSSRQRLPLAGPFTYLLPMTFLIAVLSTLLLVTPATAAEPGIVRVRLETSAGNITLSLNAKRAPATVRSFMTYVDDGRLDNTEFYRASRASRDPKEGLIQGGIGPDVRRRLPPAPFESTKMTGLTHVDGTVSMARGDDPNLATCNFSIMLGPHPSLDAAGPYPGYAAFGQVSAGMDVARRILAMPTGGGRGAMRGQMLLKPIRIVRAVRLDGQPHPSGRPKAWLIDLPKRRPIRQTPRQ